ncbi:MAG TPA: SulP family inorganic anion transporter, partial [Pseudomonadales bacterium]|nr:SulP family inorganic anion transporter [Pseudomonadales bacterium]
MATSKNWVGDILGGITAMLVALPSSIAFGVLAYSTLGPEYASMGAMAGLLGAAAMGLATPWIGRTAGLIAAPCAPAAAVLTTMMIELSTDHDGVTGLAADAILRLVALAALIAALLQITYGLLRGGSLIKFIPYPVVTGYLSGVALIIAIAQLPKVLGLPSGSHLWQGLFDPAHWRMESLLVGTVTIVLMALAPRFTQRVPAAIIGLAGGVAAYFLLAQFNPALLQLDGNTLVIGKMQASGSFVDSVSGRARSLMDIRFKDITHIFVYAMTLSVLLSIDTLKTCVGLDALTRNRHNSNRELIGQGIGNLVSFFSGGMPGAGTMGPTLVNISSGGNTYRSGMVEGIFVVLAVLFLSPLIAWVPISTLAGILLVVAWRMFDKHMFMLLKFKESRTDFAVIAAVILTAVTVDLIAAAGAGIALTIMLFIRDQISSTIIRKKLTLVQTASKTRRQDDERAALDLFGEEAVYCELQGHLFFGTTDQLFTQLENDLRNRRFILLDLRRVQSMDYTAAQLFKRMNTQLVEHNGRLLFSGMPSGLNEQRNFELYLRQLGIVNTANGVLIFDTLDGALEWMEEQILNSHGFTERIDEIFDPRAGKLFVNFGEEALGRLNNCTREVTLKA